MSDLSQPPTCSPAAGVTSRDQATCGGSTLPMRVDRQSALGHSVTSASSCAPLTSLGALPEEDGPLLGPAVPHSQGRAAAAATVAGPPNSGQLVGGVGGGRSTQSLERPAACPERGVAAVASAKPAGCASVACARPVQAAATASASRPLAAATAVPGHASAVIAVPARPVSVAASITARVAPKSNAATQTAVGAPGGQAARKPNAVFRRAEEMAAATMLQAMIKGGYARRSPHLLPGCRVEVVLPGAPVRRAGVCRWRGALASSGSTLLLGVELDEPVGQHGGAVDGVQYFECAPRHGAFVPPSRAKLEDDEFDFDFDLEGSDEGSDGGGDVPAGGELDFEVDSNQSEADVPTAQQPLATKGTVRASDAARSAAAAETTRASEAAKEQMLRQQDRTAALLQSVFRGRRARLQAQLRAMSELFTPPPDKVSFSARGELCALVQVVHGGTPHDWQLRLSAQSAAGDKSLDRLVQRVRMDITGVPRPLFRTLRTPPFSVSGSDAGKTRQLHATLLVHWHPWFAEPPLELTHELLLDGAGGVSQFEITLRHPDVRVGRPQEVTVTEIEMAIVVQRRWRCRQHGVDLLQPTRVGLAGGASGRAALSIQSLARATTARKGAAAMRYTRAAKGVAGWSELQERVDLLPEAHPAGWSELQESGVEAKARRQWQRQQVLQQRALRLNGDGVRAVRCQPSGGGGGGPGAEPLGGSEGHVCQSHTHHLGRAGEPEEEFEEERGASDRRHGSAAALQAQVRGRRARSLASAERERHRAAAAARGSPQARKAQSPSRSLLAEQRTPVRSNGSSAGTTNGSAAVLIQSHARRRRGSLEARQRARREALSVHSPRGADTFQGRSGDRREQRLVDAQPTLSNVARSRVDRSAVEIQAAVRGRKARRNSRSLQEQSAVGMEQREHAAAHSLQVGWRGRQDRQLVAWMGAMRDAAAGLGASELCALQPDEFELLLRRELAQLDAAKTVAVAREDFESAKRFKDMVSAALELASRLAREEGQKRRAVQFQDYPAAAQRKLEIDRLREELAAVVYGGLGDGAAAEAQEHLSAHAVEEQDRLVLHHQASQESAAAYDGRPPTRDSAASFGASSSRTATCPPTRHQSPKRPCVSGPPGSPRPPTGDTTPQRLGTPERSFRQRTPQRMDSPGGTGGTAGGGAAGGGVPRSLTPQEAAIARTVVDTFGEEVGILFFSDKEALRQAALERVGEMLGSPEINSQRRLVLQVAGQMISRSISADRSPAVLRAALQLLRALLHSTVALAASVDSARMAQRLLPAFLSRVAEELFAEQEARGRTVGAAGLVGDSPALSEGSAVVSDAMRWLAHHPTVGGARLAAAVLSFDPSQA